MHNIFTFSLTCAFSELYPCSRSEPETPIYRDFVELYRRCMSRLFEQGRASPYDKLCNTDETLFHVAVNDLWKPQHSTIQCLVELSIPYEEVDSYGR